MHNHVYPPKFNNPNNQPRGTISRPKTCKKASTGPTLKSAVITHSFLPTLPISRNRIRQSGISMISNRLFTKPLQSNGVAAGVSETPEEPACSCPANPCNASKPASPPPETCFPTSIKPAKGASQPERPSAKPKIIKIKPGTLTAAKKAPNSTRPIRRQGARYQSRNS